MIDDVHVGSLEALRVGDVELDRRGRAVRRNGENISLQPRVFDLFLYLVEHRHRIVTKSELLANVWQGDVVVPDALTTALHSLRRALHDVRRKPSYVRTVHGVGYQLVAPVTIASSPVLEARHGAFVGRKDETQSFMDLLASGAERRLFYVHGPPGIGKTTLLQELSYRCRSIGISGLWLTPDVAGPSPGAFVAAMARALSCKPSIDDIRALLEARPHVVFVDDVHLLAALETWLHDDLWASLPATTILVLAGRPPPSSIWRADLRSNEHARAVDLAAFSEQDVRALFEARRLAPDAVHDTWTFTRGHPLAIALVADTMATSRLEGDLVHRPDIVDALVERFTDDIADASRRRAFEAACLVDEVTERTLAALDDEANAADRLAWLSTLSFVEQRERSIRIHTLVREAVVARLARRQPARCADLVERAFRLIHQEFVRAPDPEAKLRVTNMFMELGRFYPALHSAYAASDAGPECTARPATGRDLAFLPDILRTHEGEESAAIAERWLAHPNTTAWVIDDGSDVPAGFLVNVRIDVSDEAAAAHDPVTSELLRFLRETRRASAGDEVLVCRVLVARDDYQTPSPIMRLCHTVITYVYLWHGIHAPAVEHVFIVYGDAEPWEPVTTAMRAERLHDREVTIGRRRFVPFLRSLEKPMDAWLLQRGADLVEALRAQSSASP